VRRVGLLALLLALVAGVPAWGAPRVSGTLKEKKDALGQVRRQLEQARARASAARSREVSLLAELERIDRTLARKRAELVRLDARIGQVEAELRQLEDRRGEVAEDIVAQQGALGARLRALDGLRQAPGAPAWLGEATALARARAREDLTRVARADLVRLVAIGQTAERLQARQAAVAERRRELVGLRKAVVAERAAMNAEAERRRVLLGGVRDDRATHERMVAELEEASRRLEALVQELTRRAAARAATRRAAVRPAEPGRPRPPAVGLGALRGQLPWPTEGRIVAEFGRQVHPRFGTATFRHGVDIEAREGAPIRAVHAGSVLYRGWLRGYGNLIILDHGSGYYTLYAHASELLVDEGDRVMAGQAIARVGETGSLAGPRLYFEVRYQGRAEDPAEWLRRRS
jgi:septal ring factor EnvC (AmiA/AmiB activator)